MPCNGFGHPQWTARHSSASWQPAMAPLLWWSDSKLPVPSVCLLLPIMADCSRSLVPSWNSSHPTSTQEHGSELSVPPVVPSLQHRHLRQPQVVTALSCCPTSFGYVSRAGPNSSCPTLLKEASVVRSVVFKDRILSSTDSRGSNRALCRPERMTDWSQEGIRHCLGGFDLLGLPGT